MLATALARASPRSKIGCFEAIVVLDNTAQHHFGRVPPAEGAPALAISVSLTRRRDSEEFLISALLRDFLARYEYV